MSIIEYESLDFNSFLCNPFSKIEENVDFYDSYNQAIEQNRPYNFDESSNLFELEEEAKPSEIKYELILSGKSNITNEKIPSKNYENDSNSKKETNINTNKNDSNSENETQKEKQKEKEKENILDKSNLLKKKRGRKTKTDSTKEKIHTKLSADNLNKKLKYLIINNLMEYINKKNKTSKNKRRYDGKLLTMENSQINNTTVNFNKEFLNKTLKEIFSKDISTRNTTCEKDHNRTLINSLINNEDEDKKILFTNIFDYTFKNCLEHFRGSVKYFYLDGLTTFDDIKNNFEDDKEYLDALKNYLDNYEENVSGKYKLKVNH